MHSIVYKVLNIHQGNSSQVLFGFPLFLHDSLRLHDSLLPFSSQYILWEPAIRHKEHCPNTTSLLKIIFPEVMWPLGKMECQVKVRWANCMSFYLAVMWLPEISFFTESIHTDNQFLCLFLKNELKIKPVWYINHTNIILEYGVWISTSGLGVQSMQYRLLDKMPMDTDVEDLGLL
jgi:hypothetical protein